MNGIRPGGPLSALPPLAVLDACSLYPYVLRETLLHIAAAGLFQPIWSGRIVDEVVHHQLATGRLTAAAAAALRERLQPFASAWANPDEGLIARMTNHPRDRHVVATAVAAKATCIVTANLKDFPPPALAPFGLQAVLPARFLTDLYERDPDGIRQVLERLAAGWEPATDVPTLLTWLQPTAPRFARTVKRDLG
jgi:hypothetical protein